MIAPASGSRFKSGIDSTEVEAWRTTIKHIDSRDDERSGLDSDRDDVREVERGPGNDSSQADSHKPDADSSSPRRWPAREREGRDRELNPRPSHLRHLREQGLVETHRIPGSGDHAVVLTKEGRGLLESHRARDEGARQTFYEGLRRERELEHDVQVYRAYGREAEYLHELGAEVDRVILDYELRTEYQRRLHEHDLDRDDYDGHPDRTADEIRDWALEHDLPFDDEVHFPDLRIESRELDGREDHRDIEVTTEHYPGCPWRQRRPVRVLVLPLLWFAIWWWRWHRGAVVTRWTREGIMGLTTDQRVHALMHFRFTERQARFLELVLRHAGVCVPRQYATFAGIPRGGHR